MPERDFDPIPMLARKLPVGTAAHVAFEKVRRRFAFGEPDEDEIERWSEEERDADRAAYVYWRVLEGDWSARSNGTWAVPWASAEHAVRVHAERWLDRPAVIEIVETLMMAAGNLSPRGGGNG